MKRNAIHKLVEWKNEGLHAPLFLYGIKGCGKTYLAMEFARTFSEGILYANMEQDTALKKELEAGCRKIMAGNGNKPDAVEGFFQLLAGSFDVPVEYLAGFLVVFDEVMASEPVYRTLLWFAGEEWPLCLLAITSHFPAAGMEAKASPRLLKIGPLEFDEYLQAVGSEWYAEIIKGHYQTGHKVPNIVHNELLALFEDYLAIGGMPLAINEYLLFHSLDNIAEIHKNLCGMLYYHIGRNYEEGLALKMRQVLEVIPDQLGKGNQKFQYRRIRKGAARALYYPAIQALLQDFIITCCRKMGEEGSFKLFPADVGMYASFTSQEIQYGIKKDLLDCYVMQALSARQYHPHFWESGSQARIDFVLETKDGMIPVEVKAVENTRSKSIGIYQNQFNVPYSIRISARNFEFTGQTRHIPYYAVFCL